PGDLAAKIAETICRNSENPYALFYDLWSTARLKFDTARSKVKHEFVLLLGMAKQWLKRKQETRVERNERMKKAIDQKYPPLILDEGKVYKIGEQFYNYDCSALS